MNQIPIIINGAFGKMGTLAYQTLAASQDFLVLGQLGRGEPLQKIIQETQCKVVLDLTSAECVYENTLKIIQAGAHPVIGTSGLKQAEVAELQHLCQEKKIGGLIVPNFSVAAVLMMHFSKQAALFLKSAEIIEAHHPQKKDAPSGTARRTAELIQSNLNTGSQQNVPIHSIRLPGILAKQDVIFGQTGETLTISHQTIDRQSFMPGILLACQKAPYLTKLHYGLEPILFGEHIENLS